MASYILFDSLSKLSSTRKRYDLNHEEKMWLIETINKKINLDGKEHLYSLMVIFNKLYGVYEPKEQPYYDIERLPPGLRVVWYEFTKLHLRKQQEDIKRVKSHILEVPPGIR
jgi:hypothetical protein